MPFDGPDGYVVALQSFAKGVRPRRVLGVAAWAAKYRKLHAKGGAAEAGPWRNERVPQLVGIMNALDDSHPAALVVAVGNVQFGKSEIAINWLFRSIHQAPANFLAAFPNEKIAKKWTRSKLEPSLQDSPVMRALIPRGRNRESINTVTEKHYPGGILYTGSAGVASDLAMVSAPRVLIEEVDRWPMELEGEGDPVELAKNRTAAFQDSGRVKVFVNSTPTTEEESRIWPMWLASTMERYHVPCPHCDFMQALSFDNLKWPDGKPQQAMLMCEDCAALISERRKGDMLHAGQWRAERPELEELAKGFHLNGLYTPLGLGRSWIDHARAWEQARGKPSRVQVYFNTRRGEIVKGEKVSLEWEALTKRREPYALRTIPAGVLLLTCFVDVQNDRLEMVILGWARGERIVVIDDNKIFGSPTADDTWKALDDYLARELLNSFGVPMRLAITGVDSGNWQHEVINFTRTRRARNIIATKGSSVRSRQPIGKPTLVDVNYRGVSQKRGAEQYQIGVSVLKTTLYQRLKDDAEALPANRMVRFSDDLGDEFFRQLAAEKFDPKDGWIKVYDRNEKLDCVVGAMAVAMHHSTQVHRMREADWRRLEQLYETPPAVASEQLPPVPPAIAVKSGFPILSAKVN